MMLSTIALAALVAAQANSGVQWTPVTPAKTAPAQRPHAAIGAAAAQPQAAIAPASAMSGPSAVVLWRNIEHAMTVARLRSLYAAGPNVTYKADRTVLSDLPIIEGCETKVNIMHPGGEVSEIVMRGEGSIAGRCSLKIITALSGKYGEPLDKDKIGGSLFARQGKNYIWSRDGVTLQFKRYMNGVLGGGGLFAASWELRYSVNAANIDL